VLLRFVPYVVAILVGLGIFLLAGFLDGNIKGLLINISAAFFAIPLLYLFYQLIQNSIHKKLSREIFSYAKMQIDREIISVILHLKKVVFSSNKKESLMEGVNNFLTLDQTAIKKEVTGKELLGFQLLKKWDVYENSFQEILKNSYILHNLEEDQIITLVRLFKSLRYLQDTQKIEGLYKETGLNNDSFIVLSGKEWNKENERLPDRYILLKKLKGNEAVVADFGDFARFDLDRTLKVFVINEELIEIYCNAVHDFIKNTNAWLDLTGHEFLVDTRVFRTAHRPLSI